MLKTLDVLIGATTVLLLFSMAVTVITQAITTIGRRPGRHLRDGLADLLEQLGISPGKSAQTIATSLLKHPLIRLGKTSMGTVIHREEFTKLLLDLSTGKGVKTLPATIETELNKALTDGGISNPGQALKNIRAMALQLEASNPEISNQMRDGLAILHEASSDFVARVNSWFDQTIDRVSERFTRYTHWITMGVAFGVVLVVQLDMIAVTNRLWVDDHVRDTLVSKATKDYSDSTADTKVDPKPYYDLLNSAGVITLPFDGNYVQRIKDWRKVPGMILSILLISLGAPFWYNALKNLLKLRSSLSQKDDDQRAKRQAAPEEGGSKSSSGSAAPAWLSGERGDLTAVG
jgi:hypothetical protein